MNPFKVFKSTLKIYVSDNSIDDLPHLWTEKHRYYHNVNHLIDIIKNVEKDYSFKFLNVYEKQALLLACFYHDSIFKPELKDNEDKSIKFFINSYKNKDIKMLDKVCDLIEVTKHRKRPTIDKLERIFWDADNAKFKDGYDTLLKIEKLLQKEYSFLSKKEYKQKRIEFLKTNIGLFNSSVDKDIQKLIKYVEDI